MRIFYTHPLISVVSGEAPMLSIKGRVASAFTAETEGHIRKLAEDVQRKFNSDATLPSQTIDWVSLPIVYMPDEFSFDLDIENLDRLAREYLLEMVPLYANTWQVEYGELTDLWLGGEGTPLGREERQALSRALQAARSIPLRHKVFVLGDDLQGAKRLTFEAAVREAGGVLDDRPGPECDYFVTARDDLVRVAEKAGVRQVIDPLRLLVALEGTG